VGALTLSTELTLYWIPAADVDSPKCHPRGAASVVAQGPIYTCMFGLCMSPCAYFYSRILLVSVDRREEGNVTERRSKWRFDHCRTLLRPQALPPADMYRISVFMLPITVRRGIRP